MDIRIPVPPPLNYLFDYLGRDDVFSTISLLQFIISFVFAFFVDPNFYFPSGIMTGPGIKKGAIKIKTKISIDSRLAMFLIHFPALTSFVLSQTYYPNANIMSVPSLSYLAMLVYRSLIYPLFRRSCASKYPLHTVLFQMFIASHLSLTYAHLFIFSPRILPKPAEYAIAGVIGVLIFLMMTCDWMICRARKPGNEGYTALLKWLFKYVACPQHGLQLIIYYVFFAFFDNTKGLLGLVLWPLAILSRRADIVYGWMVGNFQGYYQRIKNPCLPILSHTPRLPRT